MMNPLNKLTQLGQAVWLDDMHRDLITSSRLKQLITEDDLRGMTSNPAIFKKAMTDTDDYQEELRELRDANKEPKKIYEALAIKDVQMAADEFASLHAKTNQRHGYVSLEVDPHLARNTEATVEEALRLWDRVDRPNVYIKIPATEEGLPAITASIRRGLNINVTLLFGSERYQQVADAYLGGLEGRLEDGKSVAGVRSVASFFLSRIDVLLDPRLEELAKTGGGARADQAGQLRGHAAVASAKLAYQHYLEIINSNRWKKLLKARANPQWLLWASTSTKNPEYSDVKYVEPLIGPDTVNTVPMKTLEAYRDHGNPSLTLEDDIEHARRVVVALNDVGIEMARVSRQLEQEGINKFCDPFDDLLQALELQLAEAA